MCVECVCVPVCMLICVCVCICMCLYTCITTINTHTHIHMHIDKHTRGLIARIAAASCRFLKSVLQHCDMQTGKGHNTTSSANFHIRVVYMHTYIFIYINTWIQSTCHLQHTSLNQSVLGSLANNRVYFTRTVCSCQRLYIHT